MNYDTNKMNIDIRLPFFMVALSETIDPTDTQTRQDVLKSNYITTMLNEFKKDDSFFFDAVDRYKELIKNEGVDAVWQNIDPKSPKSKNAKEIQKQEELLHLCVNQPDFETTEGGYNTKYVADNRTFNDVELDRRMEKLGFFLDQKQEIFSSVFYKKTCTLINTFKPAA